MSDVDTQAVDVPEDAPVTPIATPYPGQWMLACRCGEPLSARDMRRLIPNRASARNSLTIPRIVCRDCVWKAATAPWAAEMTS